jgi:hypothetical protein
MLLDYQRGGSVDRQYILVNRSAEYTGIEISA